MKKTRPLQFLSLLALALVFVAANSRAASVGPSGYTNDFSAQPSAADWSTLSIGSAAANITLISGMDSAVAGVTASGVTTQLGVGVNEPPDFNALAQWAPSGLYVQTRATGNDATLMMCSLVNNIGGAAASVTISYDFNKAGAANAEEIDGQRVYYSLSGAANTWVNIPQLSTATLGRLSATLNLNWPAGSPLYILWADDNGSGSPDPAMQIDNFSVKAVAAPEVPVSISSQPQNQTVAEYQSATFTVGAAGNPTPTFQWYRNDAPIQDATNASYTLASAVRGDSGAVFKVVAANTASNVSSSVTSSNALLTVIPDTVPPTVLGVIGGTNQVTVDFSERVDPSSATNISNYSIGGGTTILSAVLGGDSDLVQLTTSFIGPGQNRILTVSGVQDVAGNVMATTNVAFTVVNFALQDIGNPAIAGSATQAPGGFDLTAGGSEIGATNDQFSFEYVQRSGDFDVKVRLAGMTLSDAWAKAGLMARADLTTSNLYAAAFATPANSGCFFQYRATVGQSATTVGSSPVTYPNTWLRLQRLGNTFTGYAGVDGNAWFRLGSAAIGSMPATVYVGVAATSRNVSQATVVQARDFQNVTTATTGSLTLDREPAGPSSRRTGLAISEIMYHQRNIPGVSNSLEFVEIYNSQAFFEKIGGYRISGSVDYTFPTNTVLQAGSYLVVARDPNFVKSYYGISNVLGPWDGAETNSLPGGSGTVRLRNRQGAVLLEVNYIGGNPWPLAADGAGHSLVLNRPSYGEGDPRAWSASDSIDGSPGRAEPFGTEPLRGVVINEFLAHSDLPLEDYIELYNHSGQVVDLSGAILTDEAGTNKFRIPNSVFSVLPPGGFTNFTESTLGFALSASGERIYLINPAGTRVIDAVDFGNQASGRSTGRVPDGSSGFYPLAARTPGSTNGARWMSPVVINELMYAPISGNDDDQYVELYNRSTNTVDLSNWQISAGISFSFPSNTFLAPGGYLVVGRNATNLIAHYPGVLNAANTLGNYKGKLAGKGERIALEMPDLLITTNLQGQFTTNIIHVLACDVTYGNDGRWGDWADGGGSSLELVDPNADTRQPANWADSAEMAKSANLWTSFEFTGPLGTETIGTANDELVIFLGGIGECLLDEVEVHNGNGPNLVNNPGFESDFANWVPQGSHDFSTIENVGYAGAKSLHLRAASRGDNGPNRVRTTALTTPASGTVTIRGKVRWLRGWPEVVFRMHGGTAEVVGKMKLPTNLGTPGQPNSQLRANAGPAIYEVSHSPALPQASENVVVTCRVNDPDGIGAVRLKYRVESGATTVTPALFSTLAMLDNGTGGDAITGDGIYSATLPGQPANGTISFYVEAVDASGATNLFPQNAFPPPGLPRCFPNDAMAHECVVRWGDTVMPGAFATYHLWLTFANSNRWAYRSRPTTTDGGLDNAQLDGTFVYNNSRVIYNARPLYAGSPWHRGQMTTGPSGANRVDYVLNYPSDDKFLGQTDSVINNPGNPGTPNATATSDHAAQTEQTSYIIFNEIGLVYNYRRYIHLFVNGSQRSTSSDITGNFIMEDSQQPNGDMIAEWFPDDTDGNLYKIEDWFEFPDDGYNFSGNNDADLTRRTILLNGTNTLYTAPYRFMFRARSVGSGESASDYSPFFALVDAVSPNSSYGVGGSLNNYPIPDPAAFDAIADVEQWMRIFAVQHTVGNWDSYGYERGKNDYTYKPSNGRFNQMTWDIDFTMGVGGHVATQTLWDANDPRVYGMLGTPLFARHFWRAMQDIVNGPLNNSFMDPILDAKHAALRANNVNADPTFITTIKTYVTGRRNFLVGELAKVTPGFGISPSTSLTVSNGLILLRGGAPITIKDFTLTINGTNLGVWPVTWTGPNVAWSASSSPYNCTNWTMSAVLGSGTSVVTVQGLDRLGRVVAGGGQTLTITNTGTPIDPRGAIVFNEIMYNPPVANASYVELLNTSSSAFDISGWRIKGLDYTFPKGSVIANGQFLVLAQSRSAVQSAYGASNLVFSVFDEFPGRLKPEGEVLTLIKPGATAADDVVINKVRYEPVLPWPTSANGQGPALMVIDPTQDNSRPSNWGDGSGWHFASLTGTIGTSSNALGTNLLVFMQAAGEGYVDDISLVPLSGATAGVNQITNGDFEQTLDVGPWIVPATMPGSDRSTLYAHSGNYSLHVVATNGGSIANSIKQLLPPINTNIFCTLSFWYYTINSVNLNVRTFAGSGLSTNVNTHAVSFTPGLPNSTLAVLPPYPALWLNETQPNNTSGPTDNFGQHDPWVELYNAGTNVVALDGLYLTSNYTNLLQWAFPAGAVINPGEFKIIWADGETNQTTATQWHTSFRLNSSTGSVALARIASGFPQVVDYLNYSGLLAGQSYGDFPDGQPFERRIFYTSPTPGAANVSPPVKVFINEWLASNVSPGGSPDPADGKFDDWIELYNAAPEPADLSGFYLTDDFANKLQWQIPEGTVIPGGGFLLVWADKDTAENTNADLHANFNLAKGGESIGLYVISGTNVIQVDAITFGPQTDNVSQGRYPDGSTNIVTLSATTPRGPNAPPLSGNHAPSLSPIANRIIYLGASVDFTASATDPDPGQTLAYSLLPGFPVGATINTANGHFQWTPNSGQAPSTTSIGIKVTDNGSPVLSDSQSFTVDVLLPPRAGISVGGGTTSLSFPTVSGKSYKVQWTADIGSHAWSDLPNSLTLGDGSTKTVTDNTAQIQRFYRIVPLD